MIDSAVQGFPGLVRHFLESIGLAIAELVQRFVSVAEVPDVLAAAIGWTALGAIVAVILSVREPARK